jgi:hypothetical protein
MSAQRFALRVHAAASEAQGVQVEGEQQREPGAV